MLNTFDRQGKGKLNGRRFILLLGSLAVISCGLKQELRYSPIANWAACAKDGSYLEMYLSDSTVIFQQLKGVHQAYTSQLNGDTLQYYIVDNDSQKPTGTIKLTITAITDSSMVLEEAVNPYERWEFVKIKENVKLPVLTNYDLHSLNKYEEEKENFFKRASKFNCVDKRSAAEILQDSLDRNSFKF